MATSVEHVLAVLRRQILSGDRPPGEKISEAAVAVEMGVSRTPARTALAALEAEGLIEKRQGRGFTIRSISVGDVEKSIAVRAALEALAAGTMARSGMGSDVEADLRRSIQMSEEMLAADGPVASHLEIYQEANVLFHETIMNGCGNDLIAHTFERIAMLPLTSLGSLMFKATNPRRERMRLTVGHSQHVIIFDALLKRDAARAEAMMREHSHAALNYSDLFVTTSDIAEPEPVAKAKAKVAWGG
ncbi:MAG: GntR family transcriptional regulator [Roseicyclus sp.]|nr:GntR family transcriptional regulator [Roseicyclus sp.]